MGYKCKTIPRHLTLIYIARGIRASFELLRVCRQPGTYQEGIDAFVWIFEVGIATPCLITYGQEYWCTGVVIGLTMHLGVLLCDWSRLMIASWIMLSFALYMGFWESYFRVAFGRKITERLTLGRLCVFSLVLFAPFLFFISLELLLSHFYCLHQSPLILMFFAIASGFLERFYRVLIGRKLFEVMVEANRFRGAWLECSERNPDVITALAELCKGITVRLDEQREEALQRLPWYDGRAQAYLEQRVGRWSLLCKGKARQNITDLDLLMERAGAINESFQDLVSKIGFNGCSVNHTTGLEFIAGPVKQPTRTLQKLVRRYKRDVGCLTDLVRCTVVADSPENVKDFLQLLYSMSVVGLDSSFEEEQLNSGDEIFMITALENRFDPSYAVETSRGYRDLALNVEVGWLISNGLVSFQKVRDWRRLDCYTHICEIQVRTRSMHELAVEGHQEYLIHRNEISL